MSIAHQHLRRCLAGDLIHGHRATWPRAMALMHAVVSEQGSESETVLREVALYDGQLQLDSSGGLPHAMSPEEALRTLAVQVLAAWNPRRHRAVIRAVHRSARNDVVRRIAEERL
jgi:hypothetical protein